MAGGQERDPDSRIRDQEALALKRRGLHLDEIAKHMGWASKSTAHYAIKRAIRDCYKPEQDDAILMELAVLDDVKRTLYRIMMSKHLAFSHGKLMRDPDGKAVYDDALNAQAALGIVRVSESVRRLLGLDAPVKTRVQVITEDDVDAAIKALQVEMAELDAAEAEANAVLANADSADSSAG